MTPRALERQRADFLQSMEITEPIAAQLRRAFEGRAGRPASEDDVLFAAFDLRISELLSAGEEHRAGPVIYPRAIAKYHRGLPFTEDLRWHASIKLQGLARRFEPPTHVRISNPKGCKACQTADGTVYALADALRLMPIPHPNCSRPLDDDSTAGFCRCTWMPVR